MEDREFNKEEFWSEERKAGAADAVNEFESKRPKRPIVERPEEKPKGWFDWLQRDLARHGRKRFQYFTDETYRKSFAVLVSQMDEPERARLNAHHRRAKEEHIENKFVRLLTEAVEGRPELEQFEYLTYVALLKWDEESKDRRGNVRSSVQQELDKLNHDPVAEFFRRLDLSDFNVDGRIQKLMAKRNRKGWRRIFNWLEF